MAKPKAYISDKLYVPLRLANRKAIAKHLHIHHFNDKVCKTLDNGSECPEYGDRPNDVCASCGAYNGLFKFYQQTEIDGRKYVGINKGDPDIVERVIGDIEDYDLIDERVNTPIRYPLKMRKSFKPRSHQPRALKEMLKAGKEHGGGTLIAPPRSGKTVMSIWAIVTLGKTAVVLAHQDDLIKQFYNTFKDLTNMLALEEKYGEGSIVRVCKSAADWKSKAPIKLGTYHRFIKGKKGAKLQNRVVKTCSVLFTDEIHRGNARAYAKTIARFKPRFQYGLTATWKRKDRLEIIQQRLTGPAFYTVKVEELKPIVYAHISKSKAACKVQNWTRHLRNLCDNKTRRKEIVDLIVKKVQQGHSVIAALAPTRQPIDELAKEINIAWMDKTGSREGIAEAFYRYNHSDMKEEVLNRARSGKTKVIVANRGMLTGVNVPLWSCFINVTFTNNESNWEQECKRVCTPLEGKKRPEIHMIVDLGSNPSMACNRSTFGYCKRLKFQLDKSVSNALTEIGKKQGRYESDQYSQNSITSIGKPGKEIRL